MLDNKVSSDDRKRKNNKINAFSAPLIKTEQQKVMKKVSKLNQERSLWVLETGFG